MAVAVALAMSGAVLAAGACGGTLEDDYRRGRVPPSEPTDDTSDQDEDRAAPTAHDATRTTSSIGFVGETAPRVSL